MKHNYVRKLLEDSHGLASLDTDKLEKLKHLYPEEEEEEYRWQVAGTPGLKISRSLAMAVLAKTSTDTSGGPSGPDGQFIRAVRHNPELVDFLLLVAKEIAEGKQELRGLSLSASIIPLIKNERDDLRPISVTEISTD